MKIKVCSVEVYPRRMGQRSYPRIRTTFPDARLAVDFEKNSRKIVKQIRRDALPAIFALMKFEDVTVDPNKVKPYFCKTTGGGTGWPGFALYGLSLRTEFLAVVELAYEDYEED